MSITDKPSRDDVLKVAGECGFWINKYGCISTSEDGELCREEIYRFAAAMYAAGAEAMRERADDAWADAIQSDCEGGVQFLSEMSANVLQKQFPCLAKLGETIRAIPITTNTEG